MPPYTERTDLRSDQSSSAVRMNSISQHSVKNFKVETVSCYRSSGSVPIPRPAAVQHFNGFRPLKKKKAAPKPPTEHMAKESTVEFDEEQCLVLSTDFQCEDFTVVDVVSEVNEKAVEVKVLVCEPEEILPPLPPAPKQRETNSCRKHSRCHCNLFSTDTEGFFAVPAPPNVK